MVQAGLGSRMVGNLFVGFRSCRRNASRLLEYALVELELDYLLLLVALELEYLLWLVASLKGVVEG
jgi:hypothetical protein